MKHKHIDISIDEFFAWYNEDPSSNEKLMGEFDGLEILVNLLNYKVFKHKGLDCPICKAKASHFSLEKTPGPGKSLYNKWHFNLYATDPFGNHVLMTKDHILAKSNGGTDDLDNLQPMCLVCNSRKGSIPMEDFVAKMGTKEFDWEINSCNIVIEQMKEFYGMDLVPKDFLSLKKKTINSPVLGHKNDFFMQYREVEFNSQKVITIFNSRTNSLLGVEKISERENIFRNMYGDLENMQERANEMFDEILDNEHRSLNGNVNFSGCKYPSLVACIHHENEIKLKRTIRHIVVSKIKKEASYLSLQKNEKRDSSI